MLKSPNFHVKTAQASLFLSGNGPMAQITTLYNSTLLYKCSYNWTAQADAEVTPRAICHPLQTQWGASSTQV